jgi:hypothetical protein
MRNIAKAIEHIERTLTRNLDAPARPHDINRPHKPTQFHF